MASVPQFNDGDLGVVLSSNNKRIGLALLNSKGRSILGHMIAYGDESLFEALTSRIATASALRRRWFDPSRTNAIRWINAEGDGLPGLIVDGYDDVLVIQIAHPGMERIKELVVERLVQELKPRSIVEKSTSFLRKKGGLEEVRAHLYGEAVQEVEVIENGLKYSVDLIEGQKTGLFLDQREMRALVRELSANRRVLNCFAYTGGFSVAALAGGATHVDSVEISPRCSKRLDKNLELNGLSADKHRFVQTDVFEFLKKSPLDYDLIILDPPAFVKKREDVPQAFRAYKEMNRHVMAHMAPHTLLLTCSCSYHVDEALFQNILFRASHESHRGVHILGKHRQALDHPISIFHPESSYIKGFLLAVL